METHSNPQDRENSSSNCSNGLAIQSPPPPTPPPLTPRSTPRSDANPYPTTFIQADTSSFKHVVQMLTGSAETAAKHAAAPSQTPPKSPIPPAGRATGPKKPAFKLYERRGSLKHLKMISPLVPSFLSSNPGSPAAFSPRKQPEILSPSMLDLPSLVLSPVTPLISDPFNRCSPRPNSTLSEEDRAIAEKGFYLHPSPRDAVAPRLLPLFPVTSPRLSSASSAATASSP